MTNNPIPTHVIKKWIAEWSELEAGITYRNDPEYGMIEFFIDGKLCTTWSYEDDPHAALEEFRRVVEVGFMMGRSTVEIPLPDVKDYASTMCSLKEILAFNLGKNMTAAKIESQGYRVKE